MRKLILMLALLAGTNFADTNKVAVAKPKPAKTNAVAVGVSAGKTNQVSIAKRREIGQRRLALLNARIKALSAQDTAQMREHRLRTGRVGKRIHAAQLTALSHQVRQLEAALIQLDIQEGKLKKYEKPDPVARRFGLE